MKQVFIFLAGVFLSIQIQAQNISHIKVDQITKEEIQDLTYDDLLFLPFEDLLKIADKMGVSVDDLLNMKITISSKSVMTPRESPGIVSIVTSDDIKHSGARDLIDILNLVPGFHFGYDLDGVIGLASRGNWGHEGKILMLLDGLEMNENFFSTYQFGNRVALDQIKRIEIIRGPGSCIYGGYAELGVINVITKGGNDLKGISVQSSNGLMTNRAMRNEVSVQAGNSKGDFEYSLGAFLSKGQRSNGIYETFDSLQFNLANADGNIQGRNANLALKYKGLQTRFIYDQFTTQSFEYVANPQNKFSNYLAEVKYDYQVFTGLNLFPKISFKSQTPWEMDDVDYVYNRTNNRALAGLSAQYEPKPYLTIIAGSEILRDNAKDNTSDSIAVFGNQSKEISYDNISAFLQANIKTPWLNFNIGGRFDHHSHTGNNLAPRIGITKVIKKFHFKALYSGAFRAPAIENINYNANIKAEKTTVAELELGYQLNKSMFCTVNFFDIQIKDAIVYGYDIDENESYLNYPKTGSRGFEIEYKMIKSKATISLNYAYYQSSSNEVTDYEVVENTSFLQGFPKHKISLLTVYKLSENIHLSPSFVLNGSRYGYFMDANRLAQLKKQKPELLLNLYLSCSKVLLRNLEMGVGVYNLLNENAYFIQPYGSSFPALPGYSRELVFKLNYFFGK